jgi:hypothetical protein
VTAQPRSGRLRRRHDYHRTSACWEEVAVGVLQRFERRIENLVNGAFAKAFKAEVQPVEIASALQRECDDRAAIVARGRTMVPNTFVIELGGTDHERLSVYAEPLGGELAEMVEEHAAEQRYVFVGPVSVTFELADDLDTGRFRVRSAAVAGPMGTSARREGTRLSDPADAPYLEVNGAQLPLTKSTAVIGRGADVDVRIDDPGVSRRHAEIRLRRSQPGPAPIVDLGSTNGLLVDGRPATQADLVDGSQLMLGSTRVVFRTSQRSHG